MSTHRRTLQYTISVYAIQYTIYTIHFNISTSYTTYNIQHTIYYDIQCQYTVYHIHYPGTKIWKTFAREAIWTSTLASIPLPRATKIIDFTAAGQLVAKWIIESNLGTILRFQHHNHPGTLQKWRQFGTSFLACFAPRLTLSTPKKHVQEDP